MPCATKFLQLRLFSLIETICLNSNSWLKSTKSPLAVDLCRSKTSLLTFPQYCFLENLPLRSAPRPLPLFGACFIIILSLPDVKEPNDTLHVWLSKGHCVSCSLQVAFIMTGPLRRQPPVDCTLISFPQGVPSSSDSSSPLEHPTKQVASFSAVQIASCHTIEKKKTTVVFKKHNLGISNDK